MIKAIDGILALMLLIGAALHAYGTFTSYQPGTELFVWSLAGSLAAVLVAVLNLLRRGHPRDRALALTAALASLAWAAIALAFGSAIGDMLDPRVIWHVVAALGLAALSLRCMVAR